MNYYGTSFWSPTDLSHYGVLGMKWGVRRYQNKDGTLTKAGKRQKREERKVNKALTDYNRKKRRAYTTASIISGASALGMALLSQTPVGIAMAGVTTAVSVGNAFLAANESKKIKRILSTRMKDISED